MGEIFEVYRFSDPRMVLYGDDNGFLGLFLDDDTGCKVKLDIPKLSERNLADTIKTLDTQGLLEFTYPEYGLLLIKSNQMKPQQSVKKDELLVIEIEELTCRIYLIDERVEAMLQTGKDMKVLPVVIMFPHRVETLKVVLQEKYRMKMIDASIEDGKVIISEKPPINASAAKVGEFQLAQFTHEQICEYKTITTDLVQELKTSLKKTTGWLNIKRVRPIITYSADGEVMRVQTGSITVKSDSMEVERLKASENYELEVLKQGIALKSVEKVHSDEERKEQARLEQILLTEKSKLEEQYTRQELQARSDLETARIKYSEKLRMEKMQLERVHREAERHAKLEAARKVNQQ